MPQHQHAALLLAVNMLHQAFFLPNYLPRVYI